MIRKDRKDIRLGDLTGPLICGVDEAGRGPLAGPVVAAAVILETDFDLTGIIDSKKLSPARRESQRKRIEESRSLWGIGVVEHETVDKINILNASLLAMKIAVNNLPILPHIVYVDGLFEIPDLGVKQRTIVHGDEIEPVVAAASILAKTYRDEIMRDLDSRYPGYGFGRHKGYPTRDHVACLNRLGPSPVHRRSFRPVSSFIREHGQWNK